MYKANIHISKLRVGIKALARGTAKTLRGSVIAVLSLSMMPLSLVPATAAAEPAPAPQWHACPAPPDYLPDGGQECATLSVPLDYRNPSGRHINVEFSRIHAANPSQRRGVLFLNPGGPGGAGLDMPRIMQVIAPQSLLDSYDLIGFDPRGIGQSTPISCGLTEQQSERAYVPLMQPNGFDATADFMKTVAQSCGQTSGDLLPYITTNNVARDMDAFRQNLGESKISYFGYSYGTWLGATYAQMYPGQTDRVVIDSSVSPDMIWRDQFRAWGQGGDVRFPDFANYVAANDATYHFGTTSAQIYAEYYKLEAKVSKNPMTLDDGTYVDGPMFRELTFSALYNDADFDYGATIWQAVDSAGTTSAAAVKAATSALKPALDATAADVPADNLTASGLAVLCGDAAWSRDVDQYKTELTADTLKSPMFGELGSNIWPCAFWPSQNVEAPVKITSNGPGNILIIENLRDNATPYWGAVQMRQAFGNRARIVSVDQGGHAASFLMPNQCANDSTLNYLVDGTYPSTDKFCPAEQTSAMSTFNAKSPNYHKAVEHLRQLTRLQ